MSTEAAKCLLIRYRLLEAGSVPIGIALYVPPMESLYLKFRDDLGFVDPDDHEVLAETSTTFRNMAVELGAKATFEWMSDTLSNVIYVEGPTSVPAEDPEKTLAMLFDCLCSGSTRA